MPADAGRVGGGRTPPVGFGASGRLRDPEEQEAAGRYRRRRAGRTARCRRAEGSLRIALPDAATGAPNWIPYGKAVLRIMSGGYDAFERSQSADNRRLFHGFFAQVLRQMSLWGPAPVIADQGRTTKWIDTLQNRKLAWDELKAGNTTFRPAMLPGLRVVRTNAVSAKLPQYVQEIDREGDDEVTKWPSGLFVWRVSELGNAGRTAFSLKANPHTAQKAADAMMRSRHGRASANEGHNDGARRASAQLEELCAVFLQPEDLGDPLRLVDLADRWRHLHIAYGGRDPAAVPTSRTGVARGCHRRGAGIDHQTRCGAHGYHIGSGPRMMGVIPHVTRRSPRHHSPPPTASSYATAIAMREQKYDWLEGARVVFKLRANAVRRVVVDGKPKKVDVVMHALSAGHQGANRAA